MINATINKSYGTKKILDSFTIHVEKGSFISIKGRSGSGKTTSLNILGLLDKDFSGEYLLTINGETYDIMNTPKKKLEKLRTANISYIFQEGNLIEYLTVYDNIVMPLIFQKRKIDPEYIDNLLNDLGIIEQKNQIVKTLSGGEKQRVAIARALVISPKLIFADEPTGSLDEENAHNVIKLLKSVSKKYEVTVLVVTHDTTIEGYFEKIHKLQDGKI